MLFLGARLAWPLNPWHKDLTIKPFGGYSTLLGFRRFISALNFRLGVVVPQTWNYIRVPVQVNVEAELKSLNRQETMLAPWRFCDETKENPDVGPDTVDNIIKQVQLAKCNYQLTRFNFSVSI